jgi:hypothetical protein
MVGQLFFMEEIYFDQLNVSQWQGNTPKGTAGRQLAWEGNVYELVNAGTSANTGSSAPVHIEGDAWDGSFTAGSLAALWRYRHSRWCIIEFTGYTDTKNMSGTIITYLCNGLVAPALTITNTANAGGLIRITSSAHAYSDGDYVHITGVGGTVAANGDWRITNVATNTFDLVGSVYAGAYTAGGTSKRYTTWKWAFGAFSASYGYPSAVSFYQDRLCLAATATEPDTVWMSEASSYESFAQRTANQITAANAITSSISSGEVNKIEAASTDRFVSGWRPAVGWVCAGGFAYTVLLQPLLPWLFGGGPLPDIPTEVLMTLLLGMLGLGGLRTAEKIKGAA